MNTQTNALPPFTPETLTQTLSILLNPSNSPHNIKLAESYLFSWTEADVSTFVQGLLYLLNNPSNLAVNQNNNNNHELTILIYLILKNTLNKYWKDRGRRGGNVVMNDTCKDEVRQCLLSTCTAPNSFKSKLEWINLASCVSKAARMDLPLKNQTLIPTLIDCSIFSNTDEIVNLFSNNSLLKSHHEGCGIALQAILEELATKRLLVDKKYMAQLATHQLTRLFKGGLVLLSQYCLKMLQHQMANHNENFQSNSLMNAMEHWEALLRSMEIMLVSGFAALIKDEACRTYVDEILLHILQTISTIMTLLEEFNNEDANDYYLEKVQDILCIFGTLLVEIQNRHSIDFAPYILPFLNSFEAVLFKVGNAGQNDHKIPTEFVISAVSFLSQTISCKDYIPDEKNNAALAALKCKTEASQRSITGRGDVRLNITSIERAVHTVWSDFFTSDRLQKLLELVVCQLMPLKIENLEEWNEDPESFYITETSATASESISASAQNFYLSLIEAKASKSVVAPMMASIVSDFVSQQSAASSNISRSSLETRASLNIVALNEVLKWDAIYTAVGVSVNSLAHNIDVNNWFINCIGPALIRLINDPNKEIYLPVFERRLVWLIGCFAHYVPDAVSVSQVLSAFFATSMKSDLCVKLTAVQSLVSSIYEPCFKLEDLRASTHIIIRSLYDLLSDCTEMESKKEVLSLISVIIGCVGRGIDEKSIKAAIDPLQTIWVDVNEQNIVRKEILSILLAVLVGLGDDRVKSLYQQILPMIDFTLNRSNSGSCFDLIEDTLKIWVALTRIVSSYDEGLHNLFPRLLGVMDEDTEHLQDVMFIIEGYVLIGGSEFLNSHHTVVGGILSKVVGHVSPRGSSFIMLVLEAMLRIFPDGSGSLLFQHGILKTMLEAIALSTYKGNDGLCEPDRVITKYLTTIARALVPNPDLIDSIMPINIEGFSFSPDALISAFISKYDNVSNLLWKKVWVLLLVNLLPPSQSIYTESILINLDLVVNMCADYLTEAKFTQVDAIAHVMDDTSVDVCQEEYASILQREMSKDPIVNGNLKLLIREKLSVLEQSSYSSYLSRVDSVLLNGLANCLNE